MRSTKYYNPDDEIEPIFKSDIFPSDIGKHVDKVNNIIKEKNQLGMSGACRCLFFKYRNKAEEADRASASNALMLEGIAAGVNGPISGFTVETNEKQNRIRAEKLDGLAAEFSSVCNRKNT